MQHLSAGQLPQAEERFQQILIDSPDHFVALHQLGVIASQRGQYDKAIDLIGKALAIKPDYAEAHNDLAITHIVNGRLEEAVPCFQSALAIKPTYIQALINLGNVFRDLGRFDEAVASYQQVLSINSGSMDAYISLGNVFKDTGRLDEAVASYQQALVINPDFAETHYNLGIAFKHKGESDRAVESFHKALSLNPNHTGAYNNLGLVQKSLGKLNEALECFHKALSINSEYAIAHSNLGLVYQELGKMNEAIDSYHQAIVIEPGYAEAHCNLGRCLMLKGEIEKGSIEYEWRWNLDSVPSPSKIDNPLWNGKESLEGRRLLIRGEQGVGDEVLFSSMYNDCLEAGAELIIECDVRLIPLFERSFPGNKCIPRLKNQEILEEAASGADYHIFSGDLAPLFRPDDSSFPKRRLFLSADEDQKQVLRKRYKGESNDILVGIAWQSKETESELNKSVPLDNWHSILNVPGIKFINIQYGDTAEQCSRLQTETGVSVVHDLEIDPLKNLDSAAAQIAALDLVISSSNAAVHLSGALGIPTWVMLPVNPHWYWRLDREDCPWYTSTKLFRQVSHRQWSDVTQRVSEELNEFVVNSMSENL